MDMKIAVVLVTYNRAPDLAVTLAAYMEIQEDFEYIVIVDNCSTDNTQDVLDQYKSDLGEKVVIVSSDQNLGGAGGFRIGVERATKLDIDWIWIGDDDAIPDSGCLRAMQSNASDSNNVYGAVALVAGCAENRLCWPAPVRVAEKEIALASKLSDMEEVSDVGMLPFLGFFISKEKVFEIGLPNAEYFISGDDVEYCIRVLATGSKLLQVKSSIVRHPDIPRYIVRILGKDLYCLKMPPWRRYYDVRNRIWNARLAYGCYGGVYTSLTLILRMILTIVFEGVGFKQCKAYVRGIKDGLLSVDSRHKRPLFKK